MRLALLFAAILGLVAAPLRAPACENREIKDEKIIAGMPPERSQDGQGFCYAYAAITVLEHRYCQEKGPCHFGASGRVADKLSAKQFDAFIKSLPNDQLSVLELITQDEIGEGGYAKDLLQRIQKKGKIAKESCAPLLDIVRSSVQRLGKADGWWREYHRLYAEYRSLTPDSSNSERQCQYENMVHRVLGGPASFAAIRDALTKKTQEDFIRKMTLPATCKAGRVKLPPFTVQTFGSASTEKTDLMAEIEKLIQNQRPAVATHCAARSPTDQADCITNGWHENVIVGSRTLCCGSANRVCVKQLKLQDSVPRNAWENADKFLDKILVAKKRTWSLLTWLE